MTHEFIYVFVHLISLNQMTFNKTARATWNTQYKEQVIEHVAAQDQKVYELIESNNFMFIMLVLVAAIGCIV